MPPTVIIIGAGAAGIMAAIFSASRGANTTLLERTQDGGRKILISGGGRCNILPAELDTSRFVTDSSPNTLRRIIRSWPLDDQVGFFEREAGIPLHVEEETAKRFPDSDSARDVRDRLLGLARRRGARILNGARVTGIAAEGPRWQVGVDGRDSLEADAVVLATGGLSVPNTGSDGDGLAFARDLGLTVHPTYPALTPLLAKPAPFAELSGISVNATVTARGMDRNAVARGGFLFTHRGYSGPAVLDVSHVVSRAQAEGHAGARVTVQWTALDASDWQRILLAHRQGTLLSALRREMPERLAHALLSFVGFDATLPVAQLPRAHRLRLVESLTRFDLPFTGHDGYRSAEVTGGGISLAEIDPRTMECRKHPGLFLCGELLDAFGPIGGYNFAWAWATGRAAGVAASNQG